MRLSNTKSTTRTTTPSAGCVDSTARKVRVWWTPSINGRLLVAAEIVELPVQQRLCGECVHAALTPMGVHCMVFSEDIWDEKIAEECELFQRSDR